MGDKLIRGGLVMINFMCQLDWAAGCPGNLVKHYCGFFCENGFE